MATNKIYTVMKDGEVLKELKTLAAAKRLADAEDAEVFCGGLCVYAPDPVDVVDSSSAPDPSPVFDSADEAMSSTPEKYRLTALMNVRMYPNLDASILGIKAAGTVVEVTEIVDDWMHLTDGSYILYKAGRYAEKVV